MITSGDTVLRWSVKLFGSPVKSNYIEVKKSNDPDFAAIPAKDT
jgi:hypothetical protein